MHDFQPALSQGLNSEKINSNSFGMVFVIHLLDNTKNSEIMKNETKKSAAVQLMLNSTLENYLLYIKPIALRPAK